MSLGTCHDINRVVADGSPDSRLNVKFVQDTSKFWYKPDISREQGEMLRIYFPLLTFKQILKHCFYVKCCILSKSPSQCWLLYYLRVKCELREQVCQRCYVSIHLDV